MSDPLYIKKMTYNVKSPDGKPITVELGARTLLVGPNESGKTAIAQAAQLVTGGSASGLLLRKGAVKSGNQLDALRSAEVTDITVTAELSSGDICSWSATEGGKAKHTKPLAIGVAVDEVRDAFGGSAETAKRFLVGKLLADIVKVSDIMENVPPALHPIIVPLINGRTTLSGEAYIALLDSIDTAAGKLKKNAAGAGMVVNIIGGAASPKTEDEMNWLWADFTRGSYADWFKDQGRRAQGTTDADEKAKAIGALKWLAPALGGKDMLASAPSMISARETLEIAITGKALYDFVINAQQEQKLLEEQASLYFKASEAVGDLLESLVKVACNAFEERVNYYLPTSDKFGLNRQTMWPGLYRGGKLHTALSGSAEARVLAAMTAALNGPGKLTVLVVDDRMWDGITLARTLKALEKAPCQVIVMSTMLPRGRRRASWKVVELGPNPVVSTEEDEPEAPAPVTVAAPVAAPAPIHPQAASIPVPSNGADADGVSSIDLDFGGDDMPVESIDLGDF